MVENSLQRNLWWPLYGFKKDDNLIVDYYDFCNYGNSVSHV